MRRECVAALLRLPPLLLLPLTSHADGRDGKLPKAAGHVPNRSSAPEVDEFTLLAVHTSRVDKDTGELAGADRRLVRAYRQTAAGDNEEAPQEQSSLPLVDYSVPSRDRTLNLMRLNLAAYPPCNVRSQHGNGCGYPPGTMEEIYENGESIYGPDVSDKEWENGADEDLDMENLRIVMGVEGAHVTDIRIPEEEAEFDFGIAALEWVRGNTTVLAFRGTYTDGDYANIENWMVDYILEKSTDRMRDAWTKDADLYWTDEMERRSSRSDVAERLAIRAAESYILGRDRTVKDEIMDKGSFPGELAEAVRNDQNLSIAIGGMTEEEAKAMGYWKITKHIVDGVASNLGQDRTLVLTGHSQGGTRAQFASMYLKKKTGASHPTVTFAATGSACAARLFFDSDANILDDVDPFIEHPNMVDYVHPLDPWGNAMLGRDNGGKVCFWGNAALKAAETQTAKDGAYKYCSRVYGWSGPTLIAARAGLSAPGSVEDPIELGHNFRRCRYFTHRAETMFLRLQVEGVLKEDGMTDGGCHTVPVIPKDDPDGLCPLGAMPSDEKFLGVAVVVGFCFVLFIVIAGACCCCRRCCTRSSVYKDNEPEILEPLGPTPCPMSKTSDNDEKEESRLFDSEENDVELPSIT